MTKSAIRGLSFATAALVAVLATGPARAVVFETYSVSNTYAYTFGDTLPTPTKGGTSEQFFLNDRASGGSSELGIDYVGEVGPGSFFFLHNDYCVGTCKVQSTTTITFNLFNAGAKDETLRFDSLITPGHLGRIGGTRDEDGAAFFSFRVLQDRPGRKQSTLYSATGDASLFGLTIDPSGAPFNNILEGDNGADGTWFDWSATDLNLEIGTLAPGETTTITYEARYSAEGYKSCVDAVSCVGNQVVFGDPRNNGGGSSARMAFAAAADEAAARDVINREYDAFKVRYAFVPSGSKLPRTPDPESELVYGANFTPAAVPEPASWATMIGGLGPGGRLARRRRTTASFAR